MINQSLKKFSVYELMSNIPEQWKRFNLSNRRDCITMVSICDQPMRAIANHLKLNTRSNNTSAFDTIEKGKCRRVMLKMTNNTLTPHENDIIRENRHEHLRNCNSCFMAFTKLMFYNTTDRVYGITVLYEINDATCNGKWAKKNGRDYFYTDDSIGTGVTDYREVGPCIQVMTGFNRHQGRISGVIYAVQHCVMEVNYVKKVISRSDIDIRRVHKGKLGLFAPAISEYFKQAVWTDADKANNYLRVIGEVVYKYYDVSINVAKVNYPYSIILQLLYRKLTRHF